MAHNNPSRRHSSSFVCLLFLEGKAAKTFENIKTCVRLIKEFRSHSNLHYFLAFTMSLLLDNKVTYWVRKKSIKIVKYII